MCYSYCKWEDEPHQNKVYRLLLLFSPAGPAQLAQLDNFLFCPAPLGRLLVGYCHDGDWLWIILQSLFPEQRSCFPLLRSFLCVYTVCCLLFSHPLLSTMTKNSTRKGKWCFDLHVNWMKVKDGCTVSQSQSLVLSYLGPEAGQVRQLEIQQVESVKLYPSCSTAPVECCWLAHMELIHPFTGFVFSPAGWHATLLTSIVLMNDHLSMWQVVLGYSTYITSSRVQPLGNLNMLHNVKIAFNL